MNKQIHRDINIDRMESFIQAHLQRSAALGEAPPLSSIELSVHGSCNRRCVFCPRVDEQAFPNVKEEFPFELFTRLVQEMKARDFTGRMSFSGFSEPLLHSKLVEMVSLVKTECPKVTLEIVSNGDYLKESILKALFDAGLDNMRVSLYTPDEKSMRIYDFKKNLGLTDEQFIIRKRNTGKDDNYGLTISNRSGMVNFDNVNLKPLTEPLKQGCNYPMYKLMVDYNADVLICSNDWGKKKIVGNLKEESIFKIWEGDKMKGVRKSLLNNNRRFAPCATCDVNGLMNGEGHQRAWENFYGSAK